MCILPDQNNKHEIPYEYSDQTNEKGAVKKQPLKTKEDQEFVRAQGPSFVLKLKCENKNNTCRF